MAIERHIEQFTRGNPSQKQVVDAVRLGLKQAQEDEPRAIHLRDGRLYRSTGYMFRLSWNVFTLRTSLPIHDWCVSVRRKKGVSYGHV